LCVVVDAREKVTAKSPKRVDFSHEKRSRAMRQNIRLVEIFLQFSGANSSAYQIAPPPIKNLSNPPMILRQHPMKTFKRPV
jgi:hypothetical protein